MAMPQDDLAVLPGCGLHGHALLNNFPSSSHPTSMTSSCRHISTAPMLISSSSCFSTFSSSAIPPAATVAASPAAPYSDTIIFSGSPYQNAAYSTVLTASPCITSPTDHQYNISRSNSPQPPALDSPLLPSPADQLCIFRPCSVATDAKAPIESITCPVPVPSSEIITSVYLADSSTADVAALIDAQIIQEAAFPPEPVCCSACTSTQSATVLPPSLIFSADNKPRPHTLLSAPSQPTTTWSKYALSSPQASCTSDAPAAGGGHESVAAVALQGGTVTVKSLVEPAGPRVAKRSATPRRTLVLDDDDDVQKDVAADGDGDGDDIRAPPARKKAAMGYSVQPQGIAARRRRHRIRHKFRELQSLVPGGSKMDTASMLEEAVRYISYLQRMVALHQRFHQLQLLSNNINDCNTCSYNASTVAVNLTNGVDHCNHLDRRFDFRVHHTAPAAMNSNMTEHLHPTFLSSYTSGAACASSVLPGTSSSQRRHATGILSNILHPDHLQGTLCHP